MKVEFSVEPADRSVGIMSEGFSAWVLPEEERSKDFIAKSLCDAWCNLLDCTHLHNFKFEWFSNETGDKVERPKHGEIVENLLEAYVNSWYQAMYEVFLYGR